VAFAQARPPIAILTERPEVDMLYGASEWWYSWSGRPEDRERDHIEPIGVSADGLMQPPSLLRPYFVL
jgi:hypothetical protein